MGGNMKLKAERPRAAVNQIVRIWRRWHALPRTPTCSLVITHNPLHLHITKLLMILTSLLAHSFHFTYSFTRINFFFIQSAIRCDDALNKFVRCDMYESLPDVRGNTTKKERKKNSSHLCRMFACRNPLHGWLQIVCGDLRWIIHACMVSENRLRVSFSDCCHL